MGTSLSNDTRLESGTLADLEGADLCEANLWWIDLDRANLRKADLERANLRGPI